MPGPLGPNDDRIAHVTPDDVELPEPNVFAEFPQDCVEWMARVETLDGLAGTASSREKPWDRVYAYTLREFELVRLIKDDRAWGASGGRFSGQLREPHLHGPYFLYLRPLRPPKKMAGAFAYYRVGKRDREPLYGMSGITNNLLDAIRMHKGRPREPEAAWALACQMLVRLRRARAWADHLLLVDVHTSTALAAGLIAEQLSECE
jgi:hypothetical protein